jgi:4'-phosphopantetheinyl transferase
VPEPISLTGDAIHVWPLGLDVSAARLATLQAWLHGDERRRADRFRFQRHRDRFVAGRGQLREVLARYLDAAPRTLEFRYGREGKPRLTGERSLRFNLSHCEDQALLAVARDREVGVDVEWIRPDFECEQIAARFFSPAETAALRASPASARASVFFAIWTRKEAFVKAKGGGLSIPLADFDVSADLSGPVRLLRTAWDPSEARRWTLRTLETLPGFAAALAVDDPAAPLPRLFDEQVQDRDEEEVEKRGRDHPAEYRRADRVSSGLSGALGQDQG